MGTTEPHDEPRPERTVSEERSAPGEPKTGASDELAPTSRSAAPGEGPANDGGPGTWAESPAGLPPNQYPPGYPGHPGYTGYQPGPAGPYPGGYPPGAPMPPSYPGQAWAPSRPTNALAIVSLVLGIIGIFFFGSIAALVCGYLARKQIRERGEAGDGFALAGIILGWVGVAIAVIFLVFVAIGMAATGFG